MPYKVYGVLDRPEEDTVKLIGSRAGVLALTEKQRHAMDHKEWWTTSQYAAIRNHLLGRPYINEATARRWCRDGLMEGVEVISSPLGYLINARNWLELFDARMRGAADSIAAVLEARIRYRTPGYRTPAAPDHPRSPWVRWQVPTRAQP